MIVQVTQADIDTGKRGDPADCPVAQALSRLFPECIVRVGGISAKVYDSRTGIAQVIWLPPLVEQFIYQFDKRAKVQPFEFEVAL